MVTVDTCILCLTFVTIKFIKRDTAVLSVYVYVHCCNNICNKPIGFIFRWLVSQFLLKEMYSSKTSKIIIYLNFEQMYL